LVAGQSTVRCRGATHPQNVADPAGRPGKIGHLQASLRHARVLGHSTRTRQPKILGLARGVLRTIRKSVNLFLPALTLKSLPCEEIAGEKRAKAQAKKLASAFYGGGSSGLPRFLLPGLCHLILSYQASGQSCSILKISLPPPPNLTDGPAIHKTHVLVGCPKCIKKYSSGFPAR